MTTSNPMPAFRLERQYRGRFRPGMIDLSSSSPSPLSARDVLEAAALDPAALLEAPLEYEAGGGSIQLRAAIAALYPRLSPGDVLITAGASEAIDVLTAAAVRRGDTVVVQAGSYEALAAMPAARGAIIVPWHASGDGRFRFADLPDEHQAAAAIIYNNPHGPAGSIVGGTYAGDARRVADEVYRPVSLVPGVRVASVIDGDARAVSIGDLSKPLGLGGLRIGWIATRDRALLDACAGILDYRSGSVSALSARVAIAAMSCFDALLEAHIERAHDNLSSLAAFVDSHEAWLDWTPPQAGYTAFLRVRSGAPGPPFFHALAADGVFALDGAAFDAPDHVRVGFGMSSSELARGLAAFSRALRLHVEPSALPPATGDVIVLAKQPVAGYAKTRLARAVGSDEAARLAEAFLRDTLAFAAARGRRLYVACAPDASAFRTFAPGAGCFPQPDGDLGARLAHAFEAAFRDDASRPVLVGTDSPTLPSQLLTAAHDALASHDVVIGPALDGGYYLIGMRELHRGLFDRIDWSSESVFAQTIARVRDEGLDVFVLPRWYDVDDASGLARLRRDRGARAHTAAALHAGAMVEAAG